MINFSDGTKKLISDINDRIKKQYIKYSIEQNEVWWIDRYNLIRDASWPDCLCYQDFYSLPADIQQECIHQHNFSPDIFINSIHVDANANFRPPDFLKFRPEVQKCLINNIDIIENKKIIDFACYLGTWSFFAADKNCKQVLGVDVREENLQIANSIKKDCAADDQQISFLQSDIHDYKKNSELCSDADTVFLFGIMYHVHDHYEIIKSVCQPTVKHIAIVTGIYENEQPVIWWKKEPTFELISGWENNKNEILVGYPTISYFDLILDMLGFKKIAQDRYSINMSQQKTKEFDKPWAVMIYQRI